MPEDFRSVISFTGRILGFAEDVGTGVDVSISTNVKLSWSLGEFLSMLEILVKD
jgi:hypothetical protein